MSDYNPSFCFQSQLLQSDNLDSEIIRHFRLIWHQTESFLVSTKSIGKVFRWKLRVSVTRTEISNYNPSFVFNLNCYTISNKLHNLKEILKVNFPDTFH